MHCFIGLTFDVWFHLFIQCQEILISDTFGPKSWFDVFFKIKLDLRICKAQLKTSSKYGLLCVAIKYFIRIFDREISLFSFTRELHGELVVGGKSTHTRLAQKKVAIFDMIRNENALFFIRIYRREQILYQMTDHLSNLCQAAKEKPRYILQRLRNFLCNPS